MPYTGQNFSVGQILTAAQMNNMQEDIEISFPVGSVIGMTTDVVPTKFLELDGSTINITTYEALYDYIGNDYGLGTGTTFTADAGTDELTATAHGKSNDDVLELDSTTTLPAGLSADTKYFVISATANTFQVSLTQGGAAVNITDTGTGTHSFYDTFKIPDYRGRFLRAFSNGATLDPDRASRSDRGDGTTGDEVGTKQAEAYLSHSHSASWPFGSGYGGSYLTAGTQSGDTFGGNQSVTVVASGGNETRPDNISVMFCIRY